MKRRKTMSIEAMKQALEAFKKIHEGCGFVKKDNLSKESNELATLVRKDCNFAMNALRQAIEQAEMVKKGTKAWADTPDNWVDDLRGGAEPVAWREKMGKWKTHYYDYNEEGRGEPLYTAPVHAIDISAERVDETAKRKHEWVGLTDEERKLVIHEWRHQEGKAAQLCQAIEAKLKEKNT